MNYRVSMPLEPLPVSDSFRYLVDRVGYSHRSIDARRRANGDRRVSVRVTQAQYDDIVERADTHGLKVAEYVRLVLGVYDVTDTPTD
jgi:predicted DNA binding CopG/RHH family protein